MKVKNHVLVFIVTLSLFIGFSILRFREIKQQGLKTGLRVSSTKQVLSETSEGTNNLNDVSIGSIEEEKFEEAETGVLPTNTPNPVQQDIEIKNEVDSNESDGSTKTTPPINDFYYPGANDIGSSSSELNLQSSDNPDKITDWYKDKIKSLGLNVNSFVTTSANDKVLNKLSAASSSFEINIEISRVSTGAITNIEVSIDI